MVTIVAFRSLKRMCLFVNLMSLISDSGKASWTCYKCARNWESSQNWSPVLSFIRKTLTDDEHRCKGQTLVGVLSGPTYDRKKTDCSIVCYESCQHWSLVLFSIGKTTANDKKQCEGQNYDFLLVGVLSCPQ